MKTSIRDMKQLGVGKTLFLGLQHTFAMFGATVLVPLLTGLAVDTALLMAGIGTLIFHLITKGKVPVFLGSSFAFLGGYALVAPMINGQPNTEMLPFASGGVVAAGGVYIVLAGLFYLFGPAKVMRFFPSVVTSPIIIAIGLILAPVAINSCSENWLLAAIAFFSVVVFSIWGRGIVRIVPIMLGIVVAYIAALIMGEVDFTPVREAAWFGVAVRPAAFAKFDISAIIAIVPIALASIMEHIGDVSAISATTGTNFFKSPGLHRTLLGDGIATSFSALFGGPANTTYGENTGVLALTKVYNPVVMQVAAVFAILLSFFPKFAAAIGTMPSALVGGISLMLYGMISAVGVRNVVENRIDLSIPRNLVIFSATIVSALGFNAIGGITFPVGQTSITLSGLALASILGLLLNIVLPKAKEEEAAKVLPGPSEVDVAEQELTGELQNPEQEEKK